MPETKNIPAEHLEENGNSQSQAAVTASSAAARFEHRQRDLSWQEALKEGKWPLAWCMYMFFICITWGFDGLAGNAVVSIAEFREDYGQFYEGEYIIDANWQLGFQAATLFGLVGGGLIANVVINRVGRQLAILCGYILLITGVFLQVFAKDLAWFFGGKVLTGVPLGIFTTAAPPYAAEMAPLVIRGSISAGMNFAIVLGQLIGYGVVRQTSLYGDSRSYKVLFASQWGFCAVGLAVLPFFPESPYFLVNHNRSDKARKNLERLHGPDYDYDGHMANIQEILDAENNTRNSQGGIRDCFSKQHWKRTMVATSMFFIQNACGSAWVVGYMSYFMQLAGMDTSQSFDTTVGLMGVMVVGNLCGWVFVDRFGRRTTALWGAIILAITLLVIGILAVVDAPGALWGQVAFMAIWSFVYQGTLGAVAWPIASETATTRLRAPTQALATVVNGLSSAIWSFSLPYAINPDQGNLEGKIAFIFFAVMVVSVVYIFFMVPETKGRSFLEIEQLWAKGVPPRRFEETEVVILSVDGAKEVD